MNIITQNLKNVLKNRLKDIINNSIDTFVDNLTSIFESNSSENKYNNIVTVIDEINRDLILEILKESLEEIDNDYKNSQDRKKKYVINKSNISRTITTIYGELTFSRTYYKSRLDGSNHFLLDEAIGLIKYDKYDPIVKAMAVNNAFETNQKLSGEITGRTISSLKQSLNKDTIKTIPRQSVFNWINKWNIPDYKYPCLDTPESLFIMVDEKFLGCQDLENDIMVKSFVVFEGVKNVSKGRRKLINRHIFSIYEKSAWPKFVDRLYSIYDSEKIKNIYLLSDGGTWIKSGVNELRTNPNQEIKRLLCEYHFKQAINRISADREIRQILLLYFLENNKKDFLNVANSIIQLTPDKKKTIEKNIKYIDNNYNAIIDMINFEIGSSMESHISHYVANTFSSRPKGYSSTKINKYLKINDLKNNGINIYNLFLKSFANKEVKPIDNDTINYSFIEANNNSNLPILTSNNSDIKIKLKTILNANTII